MAAKTQEGSSTTNINGKAEQSSNWWLGITAESLLTFDKTFGIHSVNAVAGFYGREIQLGKQSNVGHGISQRHHSGFRYEFGS